MTEMIYLIVLLVCSFLLGRYHLANCKKIAREIIIK